MTTSTQPKILLIAAVARNRVIGGNNTLPWHIPEDLQHFKKITIDKALIMGRTTFQSLPNILPRRYHIVITQTNITTHPQVLRCNNPQDALTHARNYAYKTQQNHIIIAGGGKIYQQMIPFADIMEITEIDADFTGDTFFPHYNMLQWNIITQSPWYTSQKGLRYRFVSLQHSRTQYA